MNWDALGAIGDFVGSIVVLVTLVYIAIQAREVRAIAAAESSRELLSHFTGSIEDFKKEDIAHIIRIGLNDWSSLSRNDQLRVHIIFLNHVVVYQSFVFGQQDLPETKAQIRTFEDNLLGLITCPGGATWWNTLCGQFDRQVQDRLNARLSDKNSLPLPWIESLPWYRLDEKSGSS
jgi:hypothetical protein